MRKTECLEDDNVYLYIGICPHPSSNALHSRTPQHRRKLLLGLEATPPSSTFGYSTIGEKEGTWVGPQLFYSSLRQCSTASSVRAKPTFSSHRLDVRSEAVLYPVRLAHSLALHPMQATRVECTIKVVFERQTGSTCCRPVAVDITLDIWLPDGSGIIGSDIWLRRGFSRLKCLWTDSNPLRFAFRFIFEWHRDRMKAESASVKRRRRSGERDAKTKD